MPGKPESFLPEDYIEKRAQRRTNIISLILFVVVMGGVVAAFYITDQQRSELQELRREVDSQFAEAARRLEQLDELQRRKEQMIHKARVTSTLVERVPRSIVLAELINNMPETLSLLDFSLESKVVQTRVQPRTALEQARAKAQEQAQPQIEVQDTEVTLQLVGVAPTDVQVAQFMTALGKADLFTDVTLGFSEEVTIDKETLRKFRIEMKLNPSIDTRKFEPTMVRRDPKMNPMGETLTIIAPEGLTVPAQSTSVPVKD